MKYYFGKKTFDIESRDIDAAPSWLGKLNLDYDRNRIGKYKNNINLLSDAFLKNELHDLLKRKDFRELSNSLFEASELVIIYKGLKTINEPEFIKKLKNFIKGPEYKIDEKLNTASHKARDIGFELNIASHFAVTKFKIDLTTNADLLIEDESRSVFLECKRPSSKNNIADCIHEAHKQLTKRFNQFNYPEKTFGIDVLSPSKVINPGNLVLETNDDRD